MVDNATAIVLYKEYPHIDVGARAHEVFTILANTLTGKIKPQMALYDCGMLGVFHTSHQPMKGFVDHMKALEGNDGVLSVSLTHCFPWGDVPDLGVRTLVITDNLPHKGEALAKELGQRIWAIRAETQPPYRTIDEALDEGLAQPGGPIVFADVSDNAGGGAPNDSTFLLRAMIERGIPNAAIGCIWDPIATSLAVEAGEGAVFDLRIGGKMGPMSGDPVDARVRVGKIAFNATQRFGQGTGKLGNAVALHLANEIDVVAISHRTQTFSPEVFTNVGIDPARKKILVVKSMQHFYAGFSPIAAHILYVAAPGALVPDFTQLPYRRARRDLWPLA
jgi:microcystin degradation protein MlrC